MKSDMLPFGCNVTIKTLWKPAEEHGLMFPKSAVKSAAASTKLPAAQLVEPNVP